MLLIGNISYTHTNLGHKTFPLICSSLPKCKSSFLAYYFANFSRFPRILCMHLYYFDTSLNINKSPGYNNTHPWLRTNYIQRKKCHKSNDYTDVALKKKLFGLFLLRKNKIDSTVQFCSAFSLPPLVVAQDFFLFKVMSLASEKECTLKYSWIIFSKRLFLEYLCRIDSSDSL